MIYIVVLIHVIGYFLFGFIIGSAWMQSKETKFGIMAKFNCDNCEASGCQSKWCQSRRKNK